MIATLWLHFQYGGLVMFPLAFCLLGIVLIVVGRAIFLFRSWRGSHAFCHALRRHLLSRDLGGAIALARTKNTPVSRVALAALEAAPPANTAVGDAEGRVQLAIDGAVLAQVPRLWRATPFLVPIGNLGVLLGLYGTITGLGRGCYCGGESIDPGQKARILAEGIGEAMNATAFGLIVAVLAVAMYGITRYGTNVVESSMRIVAFETARLVLNHRGQFVSSQALDESSAIPGLPRSGQGVMRNAGCLRLDSRPVSRERTSGHSAQPSTLSGEASDDVVIAMIFWGDDLLATYGWRPRRDRPCEVEIKELGDVPATKLRIESDGAGMIHWKYDQPSCPPSCAFDVRVESVRRMSCGAVQALFPWLSGAGGSNARGIAAALVSLGAHAAFMVSTMSSLGSLVGDDDGDRLYLSQQSTCDNCGRDSRLTLVRIVQTPTAPNEIAQSCPAGASNCGAPDSFLGTNAGRDDVHDVAARSGLEPSAGHAFHNWARRTSKQIAPTGMPHEHVVEPGESLRAIANEYEISDWRCFYDRRINPDFVERRPNPDMIWVGDPLFIPEACIDGEPYAPLGR